MSKVLLQGLYSTYAGELRLVQVSKDKFVIEREHTVSDATQKLTSYWREERTIDEDDYELLWLCQQVAGLK